MTAKQEQALRIAITGTSRGLGLEFARQYLAGGHTVYALARRPSESSGLQDLEDEYPECLHRIACDITDDASIAAAVAAVDKQTDAVDLLINNSGIYGERGSQLEGLDYDDMRAVFETNVIGTLRVSELCLPLLRTGHRPRIVHITSRMGSIDDNGSGSSWAYRISKAGLNMAGVNMALELRAAGIATMLLHPGWVRTDMGGTGAPLSIEDSVAGMRRVIAGLDLADSGSFRDYTGDVVPW